MAEHSIHQSQKKILISISLVGLILAVKLSFAVLTNSLALLSDSWHLVTDFAALIISWWGLKVATKKADYKNTYGYYRYSVLSALINNVSLITISFFIFYKAIDRFLRPVIVEPRGMILVAITGMIVNLLIVLNLRQNTNNLNVKSAFLHFAGDALADLGVLILKSLKYLPKNTTMNLPNKPANYVRHIFFHLHQTPAVDSLGFSIKSHSD